MMEREMTMTITQIIANHIAPYMKEHHFRYLKKCFYKIQNDIAFCVQFDATEGLVYATYFVMPLYIPCSTRYYTYGHRITDLPASQLRPLSREATDDEIEKWCALLCHYLTDHVFPFFQRISTPKQLVKLVERKLLLRQNLFSCPPVQIFRLLMFSYLQMGEYRTLLKIIRKYKKAIQTCGFFTDEVRDQYFDEINIVIHMMQDGNDASQQYCSATIADTISKCFN